ncbi:MAG TPA: pyruvate, phosphate dikinase [Egicoccus sp.]|nr:pyruvate, phosphate dikinase [Egicoccus sp.]HSK23168.1 pyruvate, phosphate dikinase [Egicoccus sp.]
MSAIATPRPPKSAGPPPDPQLRWIRRFREGTADQRFLLGGKGANLAEMTRMGLPVPDGFTITTDACRAYLETGGLPDGLVEELRVVIGELEQETGQRFGDPDRPLLVSVRSGAAFSMPGMMDTVLNLGLTNTSRLGLAARTGDPWFAADAYRRLLELYASVVLEVDGDALHHATSRILSMHGVKDASGLDLIGLEDLIGVLEVTIADQASRPFPADPWEQLEQAVGAVFRSWNGRRARDYRRVEGIADDLGTAVNVQLMVFGNAGSDSGTGVAFTRDPATGEPKAVGDFLLNAQGEDVVAGVRNTLPLDQLAVHFPECSAELDRVMHALEARYHDMCDVEFTVEHGKLYMLQTRVGKRTALASLRMAVEMAEEGLITHDDALRRFRTDELERLLHPSFDRGADFKVLTRGLPASPGAACGRAVFDADEAERLAADGERVLLVRTNTSPADFHGMVAAEGILTSRGGLVSHAAVVARGLGTPAVCGAEELVVDRSGTFASVNGIRISAGDLISIDGTTGDVVLGEVPVLPPDMPPELDRLLAWADETRRLVVIANADTAPDATVAREFGAQGIGLCRTEHQFLGERLPLIQAVILAETDDEHRRSLEALETVQQGDFEELLAAMDGLPVTVRLLDPPLHEFLPNIDELLVADARGELGPTEAKLLEAAFAWREADPMLGIRGVRLGLLLPGLYETQVRALLRAAIARRRAGGDPQVQIMIPLVIEAKELAAALELVRTAATDVEEELGEMVPFKVGAMVETPRAAFLAGELAPLVDFLSFGTNDLTQMTYGFSRDDVEAKLMPYYLEHGLLPADPFATLDEAGVGELVRLATAAAKAASPQTEISVCGEHGGDPASIMLFERYGLDDVSCSPARVLVARLAAAQAALGERDSDRDR